MIDESTELETSKDVGGRVDTFIIRLGDEVLFAGFVWIVEAIDGRLELIKIRQKAKPSKNVWVRVEKVLAI